MDFFVKHLAPFPRRFPSELPVLNMGDVRGKDHWVRRTFSTCNFSFILRGKGEFQRRGKTWKVEAPCVITQWPGEKPNYGPLPLTDTWDEVYLIYDARTVPQLRRKGFYLESRPVWKIENPDGVLAQLDELRSLARTLDPDRVADFVDRIDRVCERMILESLSPPIAPGRGAKTATNAAIEIEALLRRNPEHDFDFDALAREHGLSPSTLRRQWSALFSQPPGQYLLNLRVQKARRLLIESDARVGEVAAQVGFADILYFSRRFHLMTGLSPSAYRKRYQLRPL